MIGWLLEIKTVIIYILVALIGFVLLTYIYPSILDWDSEKGQAYWVGSTIAQVEAALLAFLGIFVLFRAEQISNKVSNFVRAINDVEDDEALNEVTRIIPESREETVGCKGYYGWYVEQWFLEPDAIQIIENTIRDLTVPYPNRLEKLIDKAGEYKYKVAQIEEEILSIAEESELRDRLVSLYNDGIYNSPVAGGLRKYVNEFVSNAGSVIDETVGKLSRLNEFLDKNFPSFLEREGLINYRVLKSVLGGSLKESLSLLEDDTTLLTIRDVKNWVEKSINEEGGLSEYSRFLNAIDGEIRSLEVGWLTGVVEEIRNMTDRIELFTAKTELFLYLTYDYFKYQIQLKNLIKIAKRRFVFLAAFLAYAVGYLLIVHLNPYPIVSAGLIITTAWFLITVVDVMISTFRSR